MNCKKCGVEIEDEFYCSVCGELYRESEITWVEDTPFCNKKCYRLLLVQPENIIQRRAKYKKPIMYEKSKNKIGWYRKRQD